MSNLNLIPIGKLFDLEKGSLQSSKCTEGEYTFITAAEEWKTHNEYSHECEALIFAAAASGSLGRTHYINDKFITSDLCFILTPKDSKYPINLKFYHFVFNSLKDEIVKNTKSGTSKESINQSNLRNYEIPYFEIDKQNLWIDKLVNTKSIKEDLELELSSGQSLLKQLKQTILQEAIEGKLTEKWRVKNPDIGTAKELLEQIKTEKEKLIKDKKIKASKPLAPINENEIPFDIPSAWEWCKFGEIIYENPRNGYSPKTVDYKTEIKTLKLGAITQGYFDSTQIKYLDISIEKDSFLWLKKGDVLIQRSNSLEHVGMAGIYNLKDTNYIYPDLIMKCQVVQPILNYFIHKYLVSNFTREYFRNNASGAQQSMPKINQGTVTNLLVPLPPTEEQKEIVATIEKLFTLCNELESEINQNKVTVDNLMATVLKEAFEQQ